MLSALGWYVEAFTGLFVVDVEAEFCGVGWCIYWLFHQHGSIMIAGGIEIHTVQRHGGFLGVGIPDAVETDLIRDVRHLVWVIGSLLLDFKGMKGSVMVVGFVVNSLGKVAFENFHYAMGICVVVDQRALSWIPNNEDQVCFSVDVVDDVARVSSALVCAGVALPVLGVRSVFGHQGLEVIGVDVGRVDARGRAKVLADVAYEVAKGVVGYGELAGRATWSVCDGLGGHDDVLPEKVL